MLTDHQRLFRRNAEPALLRLDRALSRLRSTLTFMNTGAHPDDEHNRLLALLRFGYGMRIVVACSTRGEGGQNTLGPERLGALGIVRSREMEGAARALDSDVVWLGHGPDDPVHDFGFSKSGKDTLARWGEDRIIERLVRSYRQERPDIVLPTFLDVPGQHGHHRAMTEAAERAIALAADPGAFPEHLAQGLTPWKVAKFYLPAWSGGGGTYDDEVPPPPATLEIVADGPDEASGMTHDMLGEVSRAYHASQNMGRWRALPQTRWPLHLKHGAGVEADMQDNLPATLDQIARMVGGRAAGDLQAAADGIAEATTVFPDRGRVVQVLAETRRRLISALQTLDAPDMAHRVQRKIREVDAAMGVAAGFVTTAWLKQPSLVPGRTATVSIAVDHANTEEPQVQLQLASGLSSGLGKVENGILDLPVSVATDIDLRNGFHPRFSSLGGNGLVSVRLEAVIAGEAVSWLADLEEPAELGPEASVSISPDALIVPLRVRGAYPVKVRSEATQNRLAFNDTDTRLSVTPNAEGFVVTIAETLAAGHYSLSLLLDGKPAFERVDIDYPHIGKAHFLRPQALDILALDLVVPKTRVGYIGGGADRVALWLKRMGADVVDLDAAALAGDLSAFDTIVIGIFAFGLRPELRQAASRLRSFTQDGGHLVTLYHRPSDGWNPDQTPPRRVVIGSPSLRWRVTDPAATVEMLAPEHPLLAEPNRIGPNDFADWNKERGLYFASSWDESYQPLLSMSDAGEKPLLGALISAKIGAGRHTHTSLVLHHQLDKLVPGAFRLMANLLQQT